MESSSPTPGAPITPQNNLLIPLSIIVAGVLIGAGAFLGIYLTKGSSTQSAVTPRPENPHLEVNLKQATAEDHIRGQLSAPVTIIEYSDTDCYYCNLFKPILEDINKKHGPTGQVSWIYRHFDTKLHANTMIEAEAAECVAEIGGNDKFWQYVDILFSKKGFETGQQKLLEHSQLPILATSIGINKTKFQQCLDSNKYEAKVAQQTTDIQEAGGTGTPYTFVVSKKEFSSDIQKFVEDTNNKYISRMPGASDIFFMSKDKKIVVVGGALPEMEQFVDMAVENAK